MNATSSPKTIGEQQFWKLLPARVRNLVRSVRFLKWVAMVLVLSLVATQAMLILVITKVVPESQQNLLDVALWIFDPREKVYASEPSALTVSLPTSSQLQGFNPTVQYWQPEIAYWSNEFGVDPELVATIMQTESCGDPNAESYAEARGLMQVMPFNFKPGEELDHSWEPDTNIKVGVAYLASCLDRADGNIAQVAACYNAGPGRMFDTYESLPSETRSYIYWITGVYDLRTRVERTAEFVAKATGMCSRAAAWQSEHPRQPPVQEAAQPPTDLTTYSFSISAQSANAAYQWNMRQYFCWKTPGCANAWDDINGFVDVEPAALFSVNDYFGPYTSAQGMKVVVNMGDGACNTSSMFRYVAAQAGMQTWADKFHADRYGNPLPIPGVPAAYWSTVWVSDGESVTDVYIQNSGAQTGRIHWAISGDTITLWVEWVSP